MSAGTLARMPQGITSIALVLFVRAETGSYATAGAVAAAFALGSGAGAPLAGRLIDRRGQRSVLIQLCLVHCGGILTVVALTYAGPPTGLLIASALIGGLATPPIGSALRTLWPTLMRDDPALIPTAFALDGVMIELVFVTGPLLVAAANALLSPAAAIVLGTVLVVAGTLMFTSAPPSRDWIAPEGTGAHGPLGVLRSPGIKTLILTVGPFGFVFGAMEVVLPAFAETHGSRAVAGVLLAVWSLASATGAVVYGARASTTTVPVRVTFARFACLLPLGTLPLLAAPSVLGMALLLVPAGMLIAPLLTAGNQMVADVAPASMATEAYTWPITSLVVGVSLGNAVAGGLVEARGWRTALVAGLIVCGLGGLAAVTRTETLKPLGESIPSG